MKRIAFIALILFPTFASGIGDPSESIRQFIDNKSVHTYYEIDDEYLLSGNALPLFYVNRFYDPAWFDHGIFSNNGYVMLNYIRMVDQQGLQPEDYYLCLIDKYLDKMFLDTPLNKEDMMKLDVLLTDAFMLLGSRLYYGKVNPEKECASWKMQRKDPELRLDLILEEALKENYVSEELDMLAPSLPGLLDDERGARFLSEIE